MNDFYKTTVDTKELIPQSTKNTWFDNPVMFIETCFTNANGEPIILSPAQKKIVNAIKTKNKVSIQSGTGIGKTMILALMIIWAILVVHPIKIVVVTPTAGQGNIGIWAEIMKWIGLSNPLISKSLTQAQDMVYNNAYRYNIMQRRAYAPGQEEALQGIHEDNCWAIIDEATAAPLFVFDKMRNVFTHKNGKMVIAFNPTKPGTFAEQTQTILNGWTRFKYNIFHPECQREGFDPEFRANEAREDPRTTEGTAEWQIMILGEFWTEDTEDTLISRDMLAEAQKKENKPFQLDGPVIWGLDVGGRTGRDRTALSKRRRNIKLEPTKFVSGYDTVQIVEMIKEEYDNTSFNDKPDWIYIDANNIGAGVYDVLNQTHLPVKPHHASGSMKEPKRYVNRKAELCFRMRSWFQDINCYVPEDDDEFILDCSDIHYEQHEMSNKYKIEGKREMEKRGKRSTDGFDSFMMTFEDISTTNPKKAKYLNKSKLRPAWLV